MKQHECPATKVCTECNKDKLAKDFYTKWNRNKTSRRLWAKCKECCKSIGKNKYKTDSKARENKLAKQKVLHSTPEYKAKRKVYTQEYKNKNQKKISDQKKEYRNRPEVAIREKERTDRYYADRAEEIQEKRKKRLIDNPELAEVRRQQTRAQYYKNKEYYTEKSERRRARVGKATPIWYNQEEVLELRREVKRLNKLTGTTHHLDHIVPLNGKTVCGLHCHENMQILTAKANLSKSNKFFG